MTKPAIPAARNEVVEIEAMDVAEWESGQRTPQAPDANLAELVRKTAAPPAPPARVQTVARERPRTQLGAPAIPRTPSRARTEPPGPPPKPARPQTSGGGAPGAAARATRVPDIPAGPAVEPRRSPAQTPVGGVDFLLPVTATSPGMPAAPEPRRSPTQTPAGGVDFSLPVTATGETAVRPSEPRRSPIQTPVCGVDFSRPVSPAPPAPAEVPGMRRMPTAPGGAAGFSMPAIETSSRPPSEPPRPSAAASRSSEPVPLTPMASPFAEPSRPGPSRGASSFAEPSRVGPGHNASPAGGAEPNTAWPPRAMPLASSSPPPRLAAPDPAIPPLRPPDRDDAGDADRLKVALSRRRLCWIGGGIASASLAAILAAVVLPGPDALPPEASGAAGTQAVQAPGPRQDPPPGPVDRAA
jgi:hypothetical protein